MLNGALPAPVLQTDRQPRLGSNPLVCATPVRAGSRIHSNLSAGLLMFMLENPPLLSPNLP